MSPLSSCLLTLIIVLLIWFKKCKHVYFVWSCKGVTGGILKCKDCGKRSIILWDDWNDVVNKNTKLDNT